MTVGQELMKITELRLFHNHKSIEYVIDIFGQFYKPAISRIRQVIFEEFSRSNCYGMIFTYMWAFDMQSDWDYIKYVSDMFKDNGADVYYIELVAPQEIRLMRNATENRLQNKPSKRDIEFSNSLLIRDDNNHRCESYDGEVKFDNYIKIDNSNLSAEDVAKMIKEKFDL